MELKVQNFSIAIKDDSVTDDKIIFKNDNNLTIEEIGIYTFEGINRAGKSILIKTIMGLHPPKIESYLNMEIRGKNVKVNSIQDAYKEGLVAVFQDDNMIPTMTIQDQIILRHVPKTKFSSLLLYIIDMFFLYAFHKIPTYFSKDFEERMKSLYLKYSAPEEKIYPWKSVIRKAKEMMRLFDLTEDVLSKYPPQLSGGTKAKIKIINALLVENCKILFLDEALNAIEEGTWQKMISIIKNIAREKNITVIVVSHNKEEIYKWQPKARFVIKNKVISLMDRSDYDGLEISIKAQPDFFIKYNSLEKAIEYIKWIKNPVFLLYDKNVEGNETFTELLKILEQNHSVSKYGYSISETTKNVSEYVNKIESISDTLHQNMGTIILVGGGILINFGLFIAGTIFRGTVDTIIIPTTLMAVGDVAVGSKASLNLKNKKHYIGLYKNPNCIIQDVGFLETLRPIHKKLGLIESMKHGLLQDQQLFFDSFKIIKMRFSDLDNNELFQIALKTQILKSKTLINDNLEANYANLLLFGHLHAHSIERMLEFKIEHGFSVLLGLYLDLKLNNSTLSAHLLELMKLEEFIKDIQPKMMAIRDMKKLRNIYESDTKYSNKDGGQFKIIKFQDLEQYKDINAQVYYRKVSWKNIETELINLQNELND